MASAGYTWYKWTKNHVPEGMRQLGTRQLYLMREMRLLGEYQPRTIGDTQLIESLYARGLVKRARRQGFYILTEQGVGVYAILRGDEYYEQRGL